MIHPLAVAGQGFVHPATTRAGEVWTPEDGDVAYPIHPATQDPAVRITLARHRRMEVLAGGEVVDVRQP